MNSVILIGRLARNPALTFIPGSGTAVAKFALAVDKGLFGDSKKEFESQGKPTADFIKIVVYGKQAENCSVYLEKGNLVAVKGKISTDSYDGKHGVKVYTFEIIAEKVEFLEFKNGKILESKGDDQFSFGGANIDDFQPVEDDDDVPF